MKNIIKNRIGEILVEHANVIDNLLSENDHAIEKAVHLMISAVRNHKKIIWCGNGGSAADAQHMAAELMGGLRNHDRPAIPSIALTTDSSFITAWSNDVNYESIFKRQIEGLGEAGDVLIAISTSGNSENVIRGIDTAEKMGIHIVVLTGRDGGKMKARGDVVICVPSDDTQRIQEGHLLVEHILCELVEFALSSGE